MPYTVAKSALGSWTLTLSDNSESETEAPDLELAVDRQSFDISFRISSVDRLHAIAASIEQSVADPKRDVTAREMRLAQIADTDLFCFVSEGRLFFLLLNSVENIGRFCVSVPEADKTDFLAALTQLIEEANDMLP